MRPLSCLAVLSLLLSGCTFSPNVSITTTSTIDGVDLLDSAIRESTPGVAQFACNESASGHCYYSVFTSDCRDDAKDARASICTTHRIADFSLARGESKSLSGLPASYKHCVARTTPIPPYCASAPQG
ncbi:MAG: hypothetical protein JSS42_08980 [Proteobacteria bacterium]|uniref:hypothetical protein n=1 Tax=Rudaea sp. TaxID=2136325 RepID=UPI0032208BC9|nr:hypothetical protein [Pseudomonadota bacterium]